MDISLRDLRPKLTAVIAQVKAGETVSITERGKVVALLTPPNEVRIAKEQEWAEQQYGLTGAYPPKAKKSVTGKSGLERTKAAQKARDDLLRGINKK